MEKYYIDTAVFRDYYENRKDNINPLGEFAFNFFKKCKLQQAVLLYSDLTLKELNRHYSKERTKILLQIISSFCELKKIEIERRHFNEAFLLSRKLGVHVSDVLHALIAKENNAVLVTTDRHFEKLKNIVTVIKPEEII
jgi:predicted nucleic acid-binding protein